MTPEDTGDKTSAAMQPIQALVIGTGTGDGGAVQREIRTPAGQPNIVITYISTFLSLLISFVSTYLEAIATALGIGGMTNFIPFTDFTDLLKKAALIALTAGIVGLIKDLIFIFARLKQKYPLLGAS